MGLLNTATLVEAHKENFNPETRALTSIQFICIHYTSNTNDTARANALYFHDTVTKTSAHFFVSEDTVYQSVPLNHAAYAVGLGSMKQPYFKWPDMYGKIYNHNSVSIELCGSKYGPEASDKTKLTAARLTSELLSKLGLTPSRVYRHYDVTGKPCPKWAVDDPLKWLDFTLLVNNIFYGKGEDDIMLDTPENYAMFKVFMDRYLDEKAKEDPKWDDEAMAYCQSRGLINDGRGSSPVTRSELATVLFRMNA